MVSYKHPNSKPRFTRRSVKSSALHTSKSRVGIFSLNTPARKIILAVIIMAFAAVIAAVVSSFLLKPERIVKSKLDSLASDYYENYYYEKFANSDQAKSIDNLDSAMSKYVESGFARVTLRQLILHDAETNQSTADYVLKYCDKEGTYVIFYPESPFSRTSYHTEFTYSCAF